MEDVLSIVRVSPGHSDSVLLVDELSSLLGRAYGSSGRASFDQFNQPADTAFVVAYLRDEPVGCGAVRRISDQLGEVKRMYSRREGMGIGSSVLETLESLATELGFIDLCLQTRRANSVAVEFYMGAGYEEVAAWGTYVGREETICLGKSMSQRSARGC